MDGVVTQVADRSQPISPDLALKAEIPLLQISDLQVQRIIGIGAEVREREVLVQPDREWFAARVPRPGIVKRGAGARNRFAPGRLLYESISKQRLRQVVEQAP